MEKTVLDDSRSNEMSWSVLGLAILILVSAVVVMAYRLTLPTDGWTFRRDATGSGRILVFEQNIGGAASPIQQGDWLLSVDGQPYDDILARALTASPRRPANWEVGATARYTVLRGVGELTFDVPLIRLTPAQAIARVAQAWLVDPSLIPALLVAVFVFFRRPRSHAAQLLLVLSVAFFASDGITQAVTGSNVVAVAELFYAGAYWPTQLFSTVIWPLLIAPVYVRLFMIFPVPKGADAIFPRLTRLLLYGFMPAWTLVAMAQSFGRPLEAWRVWSDYSFVDFILALTLAIVCALHTLATVRNATRRAQIEWVAWGTMITSIGSMAGGVMASQGMVGQSLLVDLFTSRLLILAFPVSIGIAILRYRLFDIDVIIHKTVIYGALSGILALVYFGSVVSLQELFRVATGAQQAGLVTGITTLGIAALFVPLRRFVQDWIDKRFYRQEYNAARTLTAFSEAVRDQVDLGRLVENLMSAVDETMQPTHVSVWLRESAGDKSADTGRDFDLSRDA